MALPSFIIRPAELSDTSSLDEICLLTGDAGKSATLIHSADHQNLLASVYALPYIQPALSKYTGGYVLATEGRDNVVGYVLYATDTRGFEAAAEEYYWPALRAAHPLPSSIIAPETVPALDDPAWSPALTFADRRIIRLFHTTSTEFVAPEAAVAFSPAHLHIDILPAAQRQGWGRRLISVVIDNLEVLGLPGVWIGLDPRNVDARIFYARLGFEPIEGAPDNYMGLRIATWRNNERK